MSSVGAGTAAAIGIFGGMAANMMMTPNSPSATPSVAPPTPMPQYTTDASKMKKQQEMMLAGAGSLAPAATLLSGTDKKTLGG